MSTSHLRSMSEGHRLLKYGNSSAARDWFTRRIESPKATDQEKADALHMAGVCERLEGKLNSAIECFDRAASLTGSAVHKARIKRDKSMVFYETGDYAEAFQLSYESAVELRQLEQDVEAYCSFGFAGRAAMALGDRREGVKMLWKAHYGLTKLNEHYELNNAVWLLMASYRTRLSTIPLRALKLAKKDGNKRRMLEIVIITIAGSHVYNFMKAKYLARR